MKIKHFAGYGCVDATKLSKTTITNDYGDKKTKIVIRVKGNHERGIERDDVYDAFNWLLKKHFAKELDSYQCVEEFTTHCWSEIENVKDFPFYTEICDYTFVY